LKTLRAALCGRHGGRVLALTLALATGAFGAVAATAQGLDEAHDTQCLLATTQLLQNTDPAIQQAAQIASSFFMGKLYGRNADYDLVAAATPFLTTLTEARIRVLLTECGAELSLRGAQVSKAGIAIQQLEK
jgi:hypothetical protein